MLPTPDLLQICNLDHVPLPHRKQGVTWLFVIKKLYILKYFDFFVGFK